MKKTLFLILSFIFGAIGGHAIGLLDISFIDELLLLFPVSAFMAMLADYIIYK